MSKGCIRMFNNHEDIVKIVEDAVLDAYQEGLHYSNLNNAQDIAKEVSLKVQQRLEYIQSQIDNLMLEYRRCRADKNCRYCPEEMSKKQLDNWAKNQRPVEEGIIPLRHSSNEYYGDLDKTI